MTPGGMRVAPRVGLSGSPLLPCLDRVVPEGRTRASTEYSYFLPGKPDRVSRTVGTPIPPRSRCRSHSPRSYTPLSAPFPLAFLLTRSQNAPAGWTKALSCDDLPFLTASLSHTLRLLSQRCGAVQAGSLLLFFEDHDEKRTAPYSRRPVGALVYDNTPAPHHSSVTSIYFTVVVHSARNSRPTPALTSQTHYNLPASGGFTRFLVLHLH
jgi:hypothetical protein